MPPKKITIWCTPEGPVLENNYSSLNWRVLTFLAGISVLRRMKLAGTNVLMPKVSRKARVLLRYHMNSWVLLSTPEKSKAPGSNVSSP